MIRINLLGRTRPKPVRTSVPLEATLQIIFFMAALVLGFGLLYVHYWQMEKEDKQVQAHIQKQMGEKARLEQIKQQVENFEKQRNVLQQRIAVIEALQRNRTGGEEFLQAIANTVGRTDTLWLTSVDRKGNVLTVSGSAASLNAVANYITQLKRSGYFQQVEIKESHQDESNKAVQVYLFSLTAQFDLPDSSAVAAAAAAATNPPPPAAGAPAVKRPAGKS